MTERDPIEENKWFVAAGFTAWVCGLPLVEGVMESILNTAGVVMAVSVIGALTAEIIEDSLS
jgi:hypothetical protein